MFLIPHPLCHTGNSPIWNLEQGNPQPTRPLPSVFDRSVPTPRRPLPACDAYVMEEEAAPAAPTPTPPPAPTAPPKDADEQELELPE